MKLKILFLISLMSFGQLSAQNRKYETVKGDLCKTKIFTLNNGLKVFLSENHDKPRIQTYIAVKTGSRNDPAETTGLAHYLEHIMFKGTQQFGTKNYEAEKPLLDKIENMYEKYRKLTDPTQRKNAYHVIDSLSQEAAKYFIPNEYDKLMSAIGAKGTNAYTSQDVTCYTEDIPSNEVENWAKIQADRFQNMVIRGFHTELEAVYEEYNIGLSHDIRKAWAALSKLLTPTHPYGTQTTIGTQEHLKNPSITNIKKYFNDYYVPNNVAICMAGDFDSDRVMDIIEKYFGNWKSNPSLNYPQFEAQAPITSPRDTTVYGQESENLMMAWRFGKATTAEIDTLMLASSILYNGQAGLLDLNVNNQMKVLKSSASPDVAADYSSLTLMASPRKGQTLEQVKQLLLEQISVLREGKFDDELIPSIINNMKLEYENEIESNEKRASLFVDAFQNNIPWERYANQLERISHITKKQIMDFANRYLKNDNYVCVYKQKGEDKTLKKIEKPQITPIPSNRDDMSLFVKNIIHSPTQPLQPKFLDFDKDLTKTKTANGLPLLYVQNHTNSLFALAYHYDFGQTADKRLRLAAGYVKKLGTDRLTPEALKKKFYALACDFSIKVKNNSVSFLIEGRNENMKQAVALFEDFMTNIKVDKDIYREYVENTKKQRQNMKRDRQSNFNALYLHAAFGTYNMLTNTMTDKELDQTDPQQLIDLIRGLRNYKHEILYYGPMPVAAIAKEVAALHRVPTRLKPIPASKEYVMQQTPKTDVYTANYDAKDIMMMLYNNQNLHWKPEDEAMIRLFNNYFGSGMNSIVFQELRETKGLAYSAGASYAIPARKQDPLYFSAFIITQIDKMPDCIKTYQGLINDMPQSQKAFDLAKQNLIKELQSHRSIKMNIIFDYLTAQKMGINYDINKVVYRQVPSITMPQMVKFQKSIAAEKPFRYIILGNEKELDMQTLQKLGPVKSIKAEELFRF